MRDRDRDRCFRGMSKHEVGRPGPQDGNDGEREGLAAIGGLDPGIPPEKALDGVLVARLGRFVLLRRRETNFVPEIVGRSRFSVAGAAADRKSQEIRMILTRGPVVGEKNEGGRGESAGANAVAGGAHGDLPFFCSSGAHPSPSREDGIGDTWDAENSRFVVIETVILAPGLPRGSSGGRKGGSR
jgi:hypothetical protein